MPVRLDTYKGCSHGCKYCFATKKQDISNIKPDPSAGELTKFIQGKRNILTDWCDWDIPLHWGGMSDPFQPAELKYKLSLDCLKIFADTGYPFTVSTKGVLLTKTPYIDLLKECNAAVQISLVSPSYDKLEPGTGGYKERLDMLPILAENSKRLIVRVQPYMREAKDDILKQIKSWSELGVHGVAFEGIKMSTKSKGLIKKGFEFVYPLFKLKQDFIEFREECHIHGLKFLAAENRLRYMGDSLTCCGTDGMEGFKGSCANLNYYLFDKDNLEFTPGMCKKGSTGVFRGMAQNKAGARNLKDKSFKEVMELVFDNGRMIKNMYG